MRIARFVILAVAGLMTACANAPVQEISDARQAIDAAGQPGGEASVWLGAAERWIDTAEEWLAQGYPASMRDRGDRLGVSAEELSRKDAVQAKADAARAQGACCSSFIDYLGAGSPKLNKFFSCETPRPIGPTVGC